MASKPANTANDGEKSRIPSEMMKVRVLGYIRQLQKELKIESVGDLVIFTCLQFMSMSEEYFSRCKNRDIRISNYDYTITRISRKSWEIGGNPWGNFAICNNIVDTNLYSYIRWSIKVNKCIRYGIGIRLGLRGYGGGIGGKDIVDIYNSGTTLLNDIVNMKNYMDKEKKKLIMFGTGDMFELIIDVTAAEIKCNRNGEENVTLFGKPDDDNKMNFKCKLFVGLYDSGNSVSIIDFQAIQ